MWALVAVSKRLATPFQYSGATLYAGPSHTPQQRANTRMVRAAQEVTHQAFPNQELELQHGRGREAVWVNDRKILSRDPVSDSITVSTEALKLAGLSDTEALCVTEAATQAVVGARPPQAA